MNKATLKDLHLELWLRMREAKEIIWTTKDGKQIPIQEMSDEHLVNAINMLERHEEEEAEIWDHLGDMDPLEYYD